MQRGQPFDRHVGPCRQYEMDRRYPAIDRKRASPFGSGKRIVGDHQDDARLRSAQCLARPYGCGRAEPFLQPGNGRSRGCDPQRCGPNVEVIEGRPQRFGEHE
jgi:hypothetical protein